MFQTERVSAVWITRSESNFIQVKKVLDYLTSSVSAEQPLGGFTSS